MAEKSGSVLAADFGSVNTRVVLIDIVDGEYRLVGRGSASTTIGYPVDDVNVGLYRTVQDIADASGRIFFDMNRRIISPEDNNRRGIDYFVTTASAGRPLRAVLIGLMPEMSLVSARRALSAAYVEVAAEIHLLDGRSEEDRLNAIILSYPDMIFITGGTEYGAKELVMRSVELVKLALLVLPEAVRPSVLYAGNTVLAGDVKAALEGITTVRLAQNIRPGLHREEFDSILVQLGRAYDEHKEKHSASFANVAQMSATGVLPTAQSYALVVDYYARVLKKNVIALDIGSNSAILTGTIAGVNNTITRTNFGVGHSARNLLNEVSYEEVLRRIPFNVLHGDLLNYAYNKTLRPATVPMSLRDIYIEHGLLRAAAHNLFEQARAEWNGMPDFGLPPVSLIIAGGSSLTSTGNPAYDMMLIAETVQATGIVQVKTDPYGIIPCVGAMASDQPELFVQMLDGNNLDHLGTLVVPTGTPTYGKTALKLKIKTPDGESFELEVKGGEIFVLPASDSAVLEIKMKFSRGLKVNGKSSLKVKLSGGLAGIFFDLRGRGDLLIGKDVKYRAQHMPAWLSQVTGAEIQPIPDAWLEELAPDVPVSPKSQKADKKKDQSQKAKDKPDKKGKKGKKDKAESDDPLARLNDNDDQASDDDDLDTLRSLM